MRHFVLLSLGFSFGLVAACSSSGDTKTNQEACQEVISACHAKDDGSGMGTIPECHEKAHLGGDCLVDLQMCLDACNGAPDATDGHGTDGHGTDGHATDGTDGHATQGSDGHATAGSDGHATEGTDGHATQGTTGPGSDTGSGSGSSSGG